MSKKEEASHYRFGANVKLNHIGSSTGLNELFPNIEDVMMSSRTFDLFEDAVASMNGVMSEITTSINGAVGSEKFKIMSEINPKFSGNPTVSKDWASPEIAKVWIVDGTKEFEGAIEAVGLAQLMEVYDSTPILIN